MPIRSNFLSRTLVIVSAFVGLLVSQADAQPAGGVVRVACVGDSITEGNANAEHAINSWPRILGRMLEADNAGGYEVGNFGRSGTRLLRNAQNPYWKTDVYGKGIEFAPDIVVINLGTNDATNASWLKHGEEFERDYRDLIEVYRGLDSAPRVFLSNLTPMYAPHPRVAECAPHRVIIEGIIDKLAAEYGLTVIDLKTPTAGKPELFPDGLHPNTAGNELMAGAVFAAITGESAPRDETIRPASVSGARHELVSAGEGVGVRLGSWKQSEAWLEGTGARKTLLADGSLGEGDFHIRAKLRMLGQKNSAAGFLLDGNFFGFEGASGTIFRNGPQMGGLRLLHPAGLLWERDAWIEFEVIRNGGTVWFIVDGFVVDMAYIPGRIERFGFDPTRSRMQVESWSAVGELSVLRPEQLDRRSTAVPWIDLSGREDLRIAPTGGTSAASARPVGDWSGFEGFEPTDAVVLRSPNGRQQLCLVGDASGKYNSLAMTSDDNGRTWSAPWELATTVTGLGHKAVVLPDGRVLVTFCDTHESSPTRGDLVGWVGSYDKLRDQGEGDFTIRLVTGGGAIENAGLELRDDGSIVATARLGTGDGGSPRLVGVRFDLPTMDELLPTRGYTIPLIDLDADEGRHVVVDIEPGQYLGHVTTQLLEDNKTILAVYPKGHGRGPIVYKRSDDAGLTWSDRLPTPESWATSKEVPTIHRVIDPVSGKKRLIVWSGLYPARLAVSEDDGDSWSELEPVGEWGGIVVMGFVERLKNGSYLAMFHDDGRFFTSTNQRTNPPVFSLYQTFSHDGGLTWTDPETVWSGSDIHLCEPGSIRSPDGDTLAVLLRENSRTRNSHVIFSRDEGETWSEPRELPAALTGDRHTGKYAPDGRLFISFRDTTHDSPTKGDWVGWVGTWEDILYGRPGQYRVRLKDNKNRWDTTYPGVEVLPDGTFVATTYGHWDEGEQPYILSARFTLDELDAKAAGLPRKQPIFVPGMRDVKNYRIPALVTTNAGTLIAAADARVPRAGDLPNNIDTVIRRSTDGGRTWNELRTIIDWEGSEGAADPCLLVDRETGRIWCAVTWADGVGWYNSKPGYGSDSFHSLLVYSDDDGLSWSAPRDITPALKDESWRSVWFSPGVGVQTDSGRLVIPYSAADGGKGVYSYAAVSDDHGETWSRVGPTGENTNESMIAQLGDGSLVSNMRSTHGLNRRAISRSTDDGESWSPLTHDDELVEPVCQASVLTVPATLTPDGREWLVFCNPASTRRENLTMRVSDDGGASWSTSRLLQSGPTSYSCMTLLPGGGIGVLYEHGVSGSAERISFAAVPFGWLMEEEADNE